MIRLMIFDAAGTCGFHDGPGSEELGWLSPLPKSLLKVEMRRFLHCASEPTPELLEAFCEAVHIDQGHLPRDWTSGFTVYKYVPEVLSAMLALTGATAVVLSNMPCTTGPSRMRALHAQLPAIDAIYTSYEMGMRKPDRRLWWKICDDYGVDPSEVVHFGDQWITDVHGAIRAGCNAVFVNETREGTTVPARAEWPAGTDRIRVVPDLGRAHSVVAELHRR